MRQQVCSQLLSLEENQKEGQAGRIEETLICYTAGVLSM
jgi:hypothetical protein